jgi:nitrate reductase NapE
MRPAPLHGKIGRVSTPSTDATATRRQELRVFLFLALVLVPVLSVLFVAGYGFVVWIWQMFAGPPGPPPP